MALITNYLDDFLFIALSQQNCNMAMIIFHQVCKQIGVPISESKTKWPETQMTFLAILIDGNNKTLGIPEEKQIKAVQWIQTCCERKKVTVKHLQSLTRLLNFFTQGNLPGKSIH